MRDPAVVYPHGQWGQLARDGHRTLRSKNKSRNTIFVYLHAVRLLGEWAAVDDCRPARVTQLPGILCRIASSISSTRLTGCYAKPVSIDRYCGSVDIGEGDQLRGAAVAALG